MWLGVGFWRVILPLCCHSEWLLYHEFRVIGGAYYDKEKKTTWRISSTRSTATYGCNLLPFILMQRIHCFPICDVANSYISIPC